MKSSERKGSSKSSKKKISYDKLVDGVDFESNDFNSKAVCKTICQESNKDKLKKQLDNMDQYRAHINGKIVKILERDSSLFVSLSQCISLFEREFLEFPQRIHDIHQMVDEAKSFPQPKFDEIPPLPKVKNSEILKQPAMIVDAPLLYDCYIQQHRLTESVDLVVNCIKHTEQPDYKPIKYLDEWIVKTRKVLHKDIQGRLKTMNLSTEEAQNEFSQLVHLGFEIESVQLFIKLATRTIDEKINAVQNGGQLLQYVHEISEILCNELVEKTVIFLKLFPDDQYLVKLIVWLNKMIESKLPISHPENFSGNFNLVKDAVIIMKNAMQPLGTLGISTLNVFDTLPKRFLLLLSATADQHMADISDAISDDDWDISLESVKKEQPKDYPLCASFEHYRSHVMQFLQEMRSLYVPEMFYDCSNLLKSLVLAYSKGCSALLEDDSISVDKFCAILVQLVCVTTVMRPEVLEEFLEITGNVFPDEQLVESEIKTAMDYIIKNLVQTFISMWSEVLLPEKLEWAGIDHLDTQFANAIEVMGQFLNMLFLPQTIFNDVSDVLIESVLRVVENSGVLIEDVDMLNSFDFHWEYFSRSLLKILPRQVNEKLKAGIQNISNQIGADNEIDDKERETFRNITLAVSKCMKANSNH